MQFLRKYSTQLLILSALLTLASGSLGYWLNRGNDTANRSVVLDGLNAFLSAFGHLALGGFDKPGPDNGEFNHAQLSLLISRLAGLAFVFFGAERLLRTLSANYAHLLFSLRILGSQPLYVVIGMGWYGRTFIANFDQSEQANANPKLGASRAKATPKNTLFIDITPSDTAIQECEQKKIIWRQATGTSPKFLSSIPWHRVKKLFVVTGSDLENSHVVRMVNEQINKEHPRTGRQKDDPLRCVVPVESPVAFEAMISASRSTTSSIELRTFNIYNTTARMLLENQVAARNFKQNIHSRLVLIGQGNMSKVLLEQWLVTQIFEFKVNSFIDVVHPDPDSAIFEFCEKFSCYTRSPSDEPSSTSPVRTASPESVWVEEKVLPIVKFHKLPSAVSGPIEWAGLHLSQEDQLSRCTTMAVVFDDLATSIRVAKTLREAILKLYPLREDGAGLLWWVYLNTKDAALHNSLCGHLGLRNPGEGPDVGFQDFLGKCSIDSVSEDHIERAGMAVHRVYKKESELAPETLWFSGNFTAENSISPPDPWDKESSRLCGLHAWVKESIIDRLSSYDQGHKNKQNNVRGTIIREMGKIEHRRWCAVHLLRGWRPLLPLENGAVPDSAYAVVREWYTPAGKRSYRSQYKHLCLMPYDSLKGLNRVIEGKGSAEQRKDRRIVLSTRRIIAYAEGSGIS